MATVDARQARTHLSRLLERVARGEEVVIAKAGKPVARLVPYSSRPARRTAGEDAGKVRIAGDFDAPLPDELLAALSLMTADAHLARYGPQLIDASK